jgi:hypothetical protein
MLPIELRLLRKLQIMMVRGEGTFIHALRLEKERERSSLMFFRDPVKELPVCPLLRLRTSVGLITDGLLNETSRMPHHSMSSTIPSWRPANLRKIPPSFSDGSLSFVWCHFFQCDLF